MNSITYYLYFQSIVEQIASLYWDIDNRPNICCIDTFRLFPVNVVYIIFRHLYNESSSVWMSLGLRPDLSQHNMGDSRILSGINNLPNELISIIVTYIPTANHLKRKRFSRRFVGDGRNKFSWGFFDCPEYTGEIFIPYTLRWGVWM